LCGRNTSPKIKNCAIIDRSDKFGGGRAIAGWRSLQSARDRGSIVKPRFDRHIYMAERHVASARHIVAAQRARVDMLRQVGADTVAAEEALEMFEKNLDIFQDHLDRLL